MDSIRCLTQEGIAEFSRYLNALRDDGRIEPPQHLLTDKRFSSELSLALVTVEPLEFKNRYEFARYLDSIFNESGFAANADEFGMWEWLTLYFFDLVCPLNRDGIRRPGADARHLVNYRAKGLNHRHLLRGPYILYRQYAHHGAEALGLLLNAPLSEYGLAATHIGERPRLLDSRGALIAANRLYFDESTGRPKSGYTDDETGVRIFSRFVNNLDPNYDLTSISPDTIIALLPDEFNVWIAQEDGAELTEIRDAISELRLPKPATESALPSDPASNLLERLDERPTTLRLSRVRSDVFRHQIRNIYGFKCAVSGLQLAHKSLGGNDLFEVQAAHIIPVSKGGKDLIRNGFALNRTVHWAFDNGMLWIDDDYMVNASNEVLHDPRNTWLAKFDGSRLDLPQDPDLHPDIEAFNWHLDNIARR